MDIMSINTHCLIIYIIDLYFLAASCLRGGGRGIGGIGIVVGIPSALKQVLASTVQQMLFNQLSSPSSLVLLYLQSLMSPVKKI